MAGRWGPGAEPCPLRGVIGNPCPAAPSAARCLIAPANSSGAELLGGLISAFTIFLSGK